MVRLDIMSRRDWKKDVVVFGHNVQTRWGKDVVVFRHNV